MNKKELVISSARKLFTEYGYKKVSMDEIAKESNVTKKTIYTYFKDKESMFKYFIDEEIMHMKDLVEKVRKSDKPFIDQISEALYKVLSYRNSSKMFNNLLKDLKKEKSLKIEEFIKLYDKEIITYIEGIINEEINNRNIKKCDAHLSAFIIYKVYLSVMFDYDKKIDEKGVTKEIISILKDGLLNKKEDGNNE